MTVPAMTLNISPSPFIGEVQLRTRNTVSESGSAPARTRRHSELPPSTIWHQANIPDFLPPSPLPTNYCNHYMLFSYLAFKVLYRYSLVG